MKSSVHKLSFTEQKDTTKPLRKISECLSNGNLTTAAGSTILNRESVKSFKLSNVSKNLFQNFETIKNSYSALHSQKVNEVIETVLDHKFKISDLEGLTPFDHFVLNGKSNREESEAENHYIYLEKTELMHFVKKVSDELNLKEKHIQFVENKQVRFFDNLEDKKDEEIFNNIQKSSLREEGLLEEVKRLSGKLEEFKAINCHLKTQLEEKEEDCKLREETVWTRELKLQEISSKLKSIILEKQSETENSSTKGNIIKGKDQIKGEDLSLKLQTLIVEYLQVPKTVSMKQLRVLKKIVSVAKGLYRCLEGLPKKEIVEVFKPKESFSAYLEVLDNMNLKGNKKKRVNEENRVLRKSIR